MTEHDGSYKQIFSHASMVEDLLRGFVHEDWVNELDFSSLEKLNGSYISEDLRKRSDDVVWRVRFRDRWLYVYLLLEFQSQTDTWMALRMLVYTGLLYQDLIKSGVVSKGEKLPPVLPVVIYNGEGRWREAQSMEHLIEPLSGPLREYMPRQRYFLLDEGCLSDSELPSEYNTLAEIIRLENVEDVPQGIRAALPRLQQHLSGPQYTSLRRALLVWIRRVVLRRMSSDDALPEFNEFEEVNNMLAERVTKWTAQFVQQGVEQGMQQGMQQGVQLGEIALLTRQLTKRFGPLSDATRQRLDTATLAQLDTWADRILDADSLDAVFAEH